MRDVAAQAGVSPATVSLVLRNHSAISEKTRQRVLRAQRKLGYKINRPAQELMRSRRPVDRHKLDSLVFLLVCARFDDAAYAPFLEGIVRECRSGQHIEVHTDTLAWPPEDPMAASPVVRDGRADGLIVSGTVNDAVCRHLESFGLPMVVLGTYDLSPKYELIDVDTTLLGREATRRLIAHGRSRIALVCLHAHLHHSQRVRLGYEEALREAGIAPRGDYVVSMSADSDVFHETNVFSGAQILDRLASLDPKPDAVLFAGDRFADECVAEMRARQMRMPEDLEVIALSTDSPNRPPRRYESILVDAETMGRIAVRQLKDRVEHSLRPPTVTMLRTVRWLE